MTKKPTTSRRYRVTLDTDTSHVVTVTWDGGTWTPTDPKSLDGAMTSDGAAQVAARIIAGREFARVLFMEREEP